MVDPIKYLRRDAAAAYLKQHYGFGARATLAKLATLGGGPVYSLAGRIPLYKQADLDAWAQAKIGAPMRSTSDLEVVR